MLANILLVIEDEPEIRRAVGDALGELCRRVEEADTGRRGIDLVDAASPDLIVLDLALPDMEGVDVCREIRRRSSAPILVLSARHSEREKVALLDAGADDYMTKPFSTDELAARARAHLRRASASRSAQAERVVVVGTLRIDLHRRAITRDGALIHLTPIEWELLRVLVTQADRTLTHRQLFDAVWGRLYGNAQQYLRVHLTNLRRKIEEDPASPRLIITEPGVGYRFEMPR